MKSIKKLIAIVLLLAVIVNLCSCSTSSSKIDANKAQLNILLALEDVMDANMLVTKALQEESNLKFDSAIAYYEKTDEKLQDALKKVSKVIASPNYIEDVITELKSYYIRTVEILKIAPVVSQSESTEYLLLQNVETSLHFRVADILQSFINLYSIRMFDKLPEEEAQKYLASTWWEFGFEEHIQCPETIATRALYFIWAEQFAISEELIKTDEFQKELEKCRLNDDLGDKECNQKWASLLKQFIFNNTEDGATNVAPIFINSVFFYAIFVQVIYYYNIVILILKIVLIS